jgi:hypothetical protein
MTEMYVQHMVDAVEGVDPDLLQYIYEAGTSDLAYNMVTLMSFYGDLIGNSMGSFMGFPGIYLLVDSQFANWKNTPLLIGKSRK